jgi:hypothetical protein
MSEIESLPVVCYIVRNMNTGKEREFMLFDSADNYLNNMRMERPDATWKMFAEIDA